MCITNIEVHFDLFRFHLDLILLILLIYYSIFRFNIILPFFLFSLGENKFVCPNKLLPFNMKSINPVQKYQHIIESYACIL